MDLGVIVSKRRVPGVLAFHLWQIFGEGVIERIGEHVIQLEAASYIIESCTCCSDQHGRVRYHYIFDGLILKRGRVRGSSEEQVFVDYPCLEDDVIHGHLHSHGDELVCGDWSISKLLIRQPSEKSSAGQHSLWGLDWELKGTSPDETVRWESREVSTVRVSVRISS